VRHACSVSRQVEGGLGLLDRRAPGPFSLLGAVNGARHALSLWEGGQTAWCLGDNASLAHPLLKSEARLVKGSE